MGNVVIGNISNPGLIEGPKPIPYPPNFHQFNSTFQVLLVLCWANLIECNRAQKLYLEDNHLPPPSTFNLSRGIHFMKVSGHGDVTPEHGDTRSSLTQTALGSLIASNRKSGLINITVTNSPSSLPDSPVRYRNITTGTDVTRSADDSIVNNQATLGPFDVAANVSTRLNKFALRLLTTVARETYETTKETEPPSGTIKNGGHADTASVVLCPMGIATLLMFTYLASSGSTRIEISNALGMSPYPVVDSLGHSSFVKGYSSLLSVSALPLTPTNEFREARKVLLVRSNHLTQREGENNTGKQGAHVSYVRANDTDVTFNPKLVEVLETKYNVEIGTADLDSDSEGVTDSINHWVKNKTSGWVRKMVEPSDFNALTRLMLLDATYFHGEWLQAFDPTLTHLAQFHTGPRRAIELKMMTKKGKYKSGYLDSSNSHYLEIPFKNNEFSLYLVLPTELEYELFKVASTLTEKDIKIMTKPTLKHDVKIQIPKFSIESTTDVRPILRELGIVSLFDPKKAQLSEILVNSDEKLYISNFKHSASFVVDEKGATGSSASIAVFESRRSLIEDEFIADRPFIFFLFDNRVSTITFTGVFWGTHSAKRQ